MILFSLPPQSVLIWIKNIPDISCGISYPDEPELFKEAQTAQTTLKSVVIFMRKWNLKSLSITPDYL